MLDAQTIAALKEALDDEYKARATYRRVIEVFGPVRPFINIVDAETRHAEALIRLFQKYDLPIPDDDWAARVQLPNSIAEACKEAVQGELENAEMYDRLLAVVKEPDIRTVLTRLRQASQENHLPAFQRCVEREQNGNGRGQPRRQRRRGMKAGDE